MWFEILPCKAFQGRRCEFKTILRRINDTFIRCSLCSTLSCLLSTNSTARAIIWLSWKSSSMTPHFPGCHRANVDCLFSLSCRGRRGGGDVSIHLSLQPRKRETGRERERERESPFTPPLGSARRECRHSNQSACSPLLAGENLVSLKCESCNSREKNSCEHVVSAVLGEKKSHILKNVIEPFKFSSFSWR